MEDLFNFKKNTVIKTNEKGGFKSSKREKTKELRTSIRDENFKTLINSLGGFPNKEEFFAIKTNGTSDCGSIFSYALDFWGEIHEMYLATWTISKANIERINQALESERLKNLVLVFSSTLKPANPALYAALVGRLKGKANVKLKEINSHAKTFSISDGKGNFITVSGSANWSENPRIENFLILNNESLFEHHKEWMSELTDLV